MKTENQTLQQLLSERVTDFEPVGGMSLRDYFAAKAMQGLIAQSCGDALGSDLTLGAQYAYRVADAMLNARKVKL